MKRMFQKAIAWLRSRVTAANTQGVYDNVNENQPLVKRKKVRKNQPSADSEKEIVNRQLSIVNSRLTIPEVEALLREKYELRYNMLTEQSEYRLKGDDASYESVSQRVYRTWLADLQADGHNVWWLEGVRIAAESMHIDPYHPILHYFDSLPQWDGIDRLHPLMQRLTDDERLVDYLCRWMLAFVAQAQGRDDALYANSVAPILISEQQGWHKSTFCRLLLPSQLRMFYTDSFDLAAESQCELRLTDCLLINLDEFDRYSARKQSTLKNIMQMPSLRRRKAYARNATTLPRVASFIGTSNTPHLLTDPTGSRRFLCVELHHVIDVDTPIDHDQLYAQCMHLLSSGVRHHFTAEEVTDIELRNRAYRHLPPIEGHLLDHFRHPEEGEQPQLFSAAEIYEYLRKRNPYLMRGVSAQNFGSLLREWGFQRVEHHHRRMYKIIKLVCDSSHAI